MSEQAGLRWLATGWLRTAFGAFVSSTAGKGHYEVELKFRLSADEAKLLPERLAELGFKYTDTVLLADSFLPNSVEGEMMRVRQERGSSGKAHTFLTFKQWVTTATGRTRKEAERLAPASIGWLWLVVGRVINGAPLLGFDKQRQLYDGLLDGNDCIASIDDVSGLGSFSGWYMEIEVLVPLSGDPAAFERPIQELFEKLITQARQPVKQSYREMLIESRQNA